MRKHPIKQKCFKRVHGKVVRVVQPKPDKFEGSAKPTDEFGYVKEVSNG